MASHDERIESLMNRSLDRDLGEAEQLELDRTLIRSPEIRRAYEQMRRIDSLAAEALRAMVPEDHVTPVPNPEAGARRSQGGARKLWWLLPAGAAAGLAVLLAMQLRGRVDRPGQEMAGTNDNAAPIHRLVEDPNRPLQPVRPGYRPHLTDRSLDHNWTGVEGNDGRIYWIETRRVRTLERPGDAGAVKLVSDDL